MIYEVAVIQVKPNTQADFEAAVAKAVPLFQGAAGCQSMHLERSVEQDDSYRLIVGWGTVDDHMVGFRDSAAFQQWRALVGDFFAAPPAVGHTSVVVTGFKAAF